MIYFSMARDAFFGASLLWKIGLIAAGVAALGTAYAIHRHNIYQSGYDDAINDVAARNAQASQAVRDAVAKVRECRDRGGTWDQSRGVCN